MCLASQRAGREFGCFIVATETVGQFGGVPVYWHIYECSDRGAANVARGPRSTVIESLGRTWLLSIEPATWHPSTGNRAALVGPISVDATTTYTAQYMWRLQRRDRLRHRAADSSNCGHSS